MKRRDFIKVVATTPLLGTLDFSEKEQVFEAYFKSKHVPKTKCKITKTETIKVEFELSGTAQRRKSINSVLVDSVYYHEPMEFVFNKTEKLSGQIFDYTLKCPNKVILLIMPC